MPTVDFWARTANTGGSTCGESRCERATVAVLNWYGVLIDVDDQKKAEEALQEASTGSVEIIETVPSMIWTSGPDGEPTHVNRRVLDYTAVRFEDLLRFGWRRFLHPDDVLETANCF